ncbi:UNVERIFIED_CONTAM: hypothetical protein Scaly_1188000 [Sesamum calycinum]|uniref:Uncharacterized protein n=1 Tax=Sesamum calycinum TaxID=2727403 RepID=A0AAW2Q3M6_9LAMI
MLSILNPLRLFTVLAFMLYAWRTVLWELSNWRAAVAAIGRLLTYISKFVLALIFHFIGAPVTSLIRGVETIFYTIRAFYSGIVASAPIPELTLIIMLVSAVLAVAEAASPDTVNSQPHLLTVAGLIGFAAVANYISEPLFLDITREPWVRVIVMASYLALAIFHHSNIPSHLKEDEDAGAINRVPVPLLCAALAIGIRVAAKWAGYRHLTWMIV